MENTTEHNETAPQNWYNAAIIFAKALGFVGGRTRYYRGPK